MRINERARINLHISKTGFDRCVNLERTERRGTARDCQDFFNGGKRLVIWSGKLFLAALTPPLRQRVLDAGRAHDESRSKSPRVGVQQPADFCHVRMGQPVKQHGIRLAAD